MRLLLIAILGFTLLVNRAGATIAAWNPAPPATIAPGISYSVGATFTGNSGATSVKVEIYRNGALWIWQGNGGLPGTPHTASVSSTVTDASPQTVTYRVEGWDNSTGTMVLQSSITATVTVVDPNAAPTIQWSQVPTSAEVNTAFVIEAAAGDQDADLTSIIISRDGSPVYTQTFSESAQGAASFTDTISSPGMVTYSAQAIDSHGVISSLITQSFSVTGSDSPGSTSPVPTEPVSTVPEADASVGTLSGEFSVDAKGAANYSIPLVLPPGRAAMAPNLSIRYSSAGGNGLLGIGFSLSTGFPQSVTRGRSILARDGITRGVNFDTSDKYYLDGKRLICVDGSYGQPGSSYRTEVDAFASITASGTGSGSTANIESFILTDKAGTKFYFGKYGTTSDGYQPGMVPDGAGRTLDTIAYAWALKRVEDTVGNSVDFIYQSDTGKSEYVLSEIDYTANEGQNIAPHARVMFTYAGDRYDKAFSYVAGRRFDHEKRLDQIVAATYDNQAWTDRAKYDFGFRYSSESPRLQLTDLAGSLWDLSAGGLTTFPRTHFDWSQYDHSSLPTITPGSSGDLSMSFASPYGFRTYAWGDFNGDGKDDVAFGTSVQLSTGSTAAGQQFLNTWPSAALPAPFDSGVLGTNWGIMAVDLNGDGKKDLLLCMNDQTNGISVLPLVSTGSAFVVGNVVDLSPASSHYLFDTAPGNPSNNLTYLRKNVKGGIFARFSPGDFYGDGCEEVLVHAYDGYRYLLRWDRTAGALTLTAPMNPGAPAGGPRISTLWVGLPFLFWEDLVTSIDWPAELSPVPCDLNGDGVTDYAWMEKSSNINTAGTHSHSATKWMRASLSDGVGGSAPGAPGTFWGTGVGSALIPAAQLDAIDTVGRYTQIMLPGDFNGDGLTDFIARTSNGWQLMINRGRFEGANSFPSFEYVNALGTTFASGGEILYTASRFMSKRTWDNGFQAGLSNLEGSDPVTLGYIQTDSSANTFVMDINHDGLADLVWWVEYRRQSATSASDEATTANRGWWVAYSTGTGFETPQKLTDNIWSTLVASGYGTGSMVIDTISQPDINGDGLPDWVVNTGTQNTAQILSFYAYSVGTFGDLVSKITDGLGRKTDIAYKAAKDASIYTPGTTVSYPIREFPSSQPVVSEVWHDSGTGVAAERAHFLYQYSGRRLDLSGRGDLGFHSFVTLDTQTNVFKYQFLTQSFPMTGLSAREQTYRYWPSGSGGSTANFRLISSHDNTLVFDKVVNGAGGAAYGTLYPFVSKAVESRWEDAATAHFSYTASGPSSHPEDLFPAALPSGAHITITAESLFDNQTAVQTTLPAAVAAAGYNPSDTTSSRQNAVAGTTSFGTFSTLPGSITYGNLTQLKTDYGDGYTEKVVTTYKAGQTLGGVLTLTGLADTVTTTVTSPDFGTETAPVKTYGYQPGTPLVTSEAIDAPGTALDFTTTHTRDGLGRITATTVSGTHLLSLDASASPITTYQATAFDPKFDRPTTEKDAYGHTTTTVYDPILGLPTSVTGPNGDTVTTQYDALGRVVGVTDAFDQSTASTYAWTTAAATDWKKTQTVTPPAGVGGLTLTSAYAVQVAPDAKPIVTTYYDRLGRPIRIIKAAFSGSTLADTVYNNLGQVVAVSNPYPAGGTVYWTKTTYDALGRVSTVTAPNGTVTTTTYNGRATLVSVDAPSLGGVNPAAQVNATVVDAKGRTVKVWNADNVPTFTSTLGATTTAPSIAFDLDGFGRMRTTTLKGQTATITATYDALGRQATLDDPDKGAWSYVNSALGYVLQQTDARSTVTQTTYDALGRPLGRATQEPSSGPLETANWFYYDSTADPATHRVALGDKGWIGALQREENATTGAPGYAAAHSATTTVHYYDAKGRPSIDLTTIDGKYFYTYTAYDSSNRVSQVRHYWRPAGQEAPDQSPYVWQDFGYSYTYDTKSYLLSIQDTATPARTWWQADSTAGYDYLDRPALVKKGSNWTHRTYRPTDGVLTAIETGPTAGSTTIQNLSFDYDGLGNLTSRTGPTTETLTYDNLNRLKTSKQGTIDYADNGNITNKPNVSGARSTADFTYDPAHPHAVASAFGYALGYDANGNLISRTKTGESWSFRYAGFDKPRWMAKTVGATTVGSEFLYDANRSRTVQLEFTGLAGGVPSGYVRKRVYGLGSTLEANYEKAASAPDAAWALKKVRIYVPGPDGIVGSREFDPAAPIGSQEKAFIYHYDHLGSIESITPFVPAGSGLAADSTGKPGRFSEDAWGARRDPTDWAGAPTTTDDGGADSLTPRGFTGHEMLDDLGFVHMNGRIYDPLLGRFLSADTLVPCPDQLQSYNRYSYVQNNPLSRIDPSGFADVVLLDPKDKAYDGAVLIPSGNPGVTTIAFHGMEGGDGFVSDSRDLKNLKMITTTDIDKALTDSGHRKGDEIVAYVCFGGEGSNLEEFKKIAASQNSPVLVATDAVQPHAKRIKGIVTYDGSTINNRGNWRLIAPDGSVRDYGRQKDADRAQKAADKAQKAADSAEAKAKQSREKAEQAKEASNAAKDSKNAAKAEKKAQKAAATATKSEAAAEAAKRAAEEARKAAEEREKEARRQF